MAVTSHIGSGTIVRGNIRGSGSIEIRGRVEGDVEVDGDVALGEDAAVGGNVSGAQILVAGRVSGDLKGTEAVLLERGARVVGDLVAPRIGIAEGALVRGSVRTEGEAPAPRRAAVLPARRGGERSDFVQPKPKLQAVPAPKPVAPPREAAPVPAPKSAPSHPEPDEAEAESGGPPAPVVPALGKGVKGKKKIKRP
jgi:cytoskeletal protein CcmA (bactofilin family)